MKIGFDAKRVFHNFRGLGNYGRNLLEGLEKYSPEHEYYLYTPIMRDERAFDWKRKHPNFHVKEPSGLVGKKFGSLWRSFMLNRELERDHIDLYHGLSHELPNGIEKLNIKKVVTIHDLIYLKFPEYFPLIDRKVYDKKFRHACRVADKVVAICQQTRDDLLEHFNLDNQKIEVCYQSCHHRFYKLWEKEKKEEVRKLYDLPEKYLLFVGAIEARKNVLGLVRALASSKHDLPLVIVGDGSVAHKKELMQTIHALGLDSRVFIRSNVASNDLPGIYQNAAIFVFPSFYEGFGIPIIEAQFSEVPVITSHGSCFPETAGAGALFIEPHHADSITEGIDRILDDAQLAQSLVHEGRKHVEKFHNANTTKAIVDLYHSLK